MSKRLLMMVVALAGIALQGMAQTDLKVPKFTKFVCVKSGVNIRKAPSTQSARLVWVEKNDGSRMLKWEEPSDNKAKTSPAVSYDEFFPVIDETPDWYHIVCDDFNQDSGKKIYAYVSKQFCKPYQQRAITESYIMGKDYRSGEQSDQHMYDGNQFSIRTTGKYKGYCVINGWLQGPFFPNMYVGKLVNGVLVGKSVDTSELYDEIPEDITQLTDSQIDKFLNSSKNLNQYTHYVYGLPGSAQSRYGLIPGEGIYDLVLDINQYEGATY